MAAMHRVVGWIAVLIAAPSLAGCGTLPDTVEDWCRDSSRCTPQCGSVATGASPDCAPWENEGRTRG